jgi:plastocyanin
MKRFLAVVCACALAAGDLAAATVSGKIGFLTKRGQHPVVNETVVWLEPVGNTHAPRRAAASFELTTRGKTLTPHVLIVPAGSTVAFPNEDPISHNLFSLSSGNDFDLGLYRSGVRKSHTFTTAGIVNVYCNVHPNMSAVIHVMSTPYYAFIARDSTFALTDVQPGRYDAVVWNEVGGTARLGPVEVSPSGISDLSITLDSRGLRATGHMNKFGKPYAPPTSSDY